MTLVFISQRSRSGVSNATHAMRVRAHKQGVAKEEGGEGGGEGGGGVVKGLEDRRRAKAKAAKGGSQARVQFEDGAGGGGSTGGGGGGATVDRGNRESTDRRFQLLSSLDAEASKGSVESAEGYPQEEEEAY